MKSITKLLIGLNLIVTLFLLSLLSGCNNPGSSDAGTNDLAPEDESAAVVIDTENVVDATVPSTTTPETVAADSTETSGFRAEALTIGSRAPSLDVEHWLSDGNGSFEQVSEFRPGQVYVVEFWATWCGPCVRSMPHIVDLQQRFGEKVQIVSISDETLEKVQSFLERPYGGEEEGGSPSTYGELTSAYCLTTDPDRSAHADYMEAAGQGGIPTAFVVGKTGLIEWIGHPMAIDQVLESVTGDEWDREAFAVEFKREQEFDLLFGKLRRMVGSGDFDGAVQLAEEAMETAPASKKSQLQSMVTGLKMASVGQMLQNGEASEAATRLKGLATDDDPQNLNMIAWSAYQMLNSSDGQADAFLSAATDIAQRAVDAAPEDGMILDTLAHLVYMGGDLNKAIDLQTKAIEYSDDTDGLQDFLDKLLEERDGTTPGDDDEEDDGKSSESDEDGDEGDSDDAGEDSDDAGEDSDEAEPAESTESEDGDEADPSSDGR